MAATSPVTTRPTSAAVRTARRLSAGAEVAFWAVRYRTMATGGRFGRYEHVYCYHVPKTAGTSLHHSFMSLGGEEPGTVWRRVNFRTVQAATSAGRLYTRDHRLIKRGLFSYGFDHLPAAHVVLPPGTFTISVFRDPVERFISYFRYTHDRDQAYEPLRRPVHERPDLPRSLRPFAEAVSPRLLFGQLAMFSDRFDVDEAVTAASQLSCLLYTEDFATGLASLATALEVELSASRERVSRSDLPVEAEDRHWLRDRLAPEYAFLAKLGAPYRV